ncbi:MAG: uncharacterized protein JWQ53_1543 [Klenkia sp.]|nr:uncharacterized protein [Klenkia sp.]
MVSRCPGCGAVLAAVPGLEVRHDGASPACTRLFDVTVRGLRDEAPSDLRAAGVLELAEATYDAQHPLGDDVAALTRLQEVAGTGPAGPAVRPEQWTTTVADVAADLDVVDLPALVRSWSAAVVGDWTGVETRR